MSGSPPVWLIAGPTASGKSALAMALAETIGGEIVNADSLQVYRDLRILTARPSAGDERRAAHHLFGVADAADPWSVGRWVIAARRALGAIAERGRPAIVVGGSGLYFRALTEGLADIPAIPDGARRESAAMFESLGETAFRRRLAEMDGPAERRIAAGDRQRLTRAMEVFAATGRSLSEWRAIPAAGIDPGSWRGTVLELPRDALYRRCDTRLSAMIEQGALAEVARLVARGLPPGSPALKALGVAPLAALLRGESDAAEALARAARETRHYAKRQLTWFRRQTPDWPRIGAGPLDQQLRQILAGNSA